MIYGAVPSDGAAGPREQRGTIIPSTPPYHRHQSHTRALRTLSPFPSTLAPSATPARPMGALCLRKWEEPGRADGRLLCISHSCVRAGASPPAGVCAMVLRWWGINPSILTATSWVYAAASRPGVGGGRPVAKEVLPLCHRRHWERGEGGELGVRGGRCCMGTWISCGAGGRGGGEGTFHNAQTDHKMSSPSFSEGKREGRLPGNGWISHRTPHSHSEALFASARPSTPTAPEGRRFQCATILHTRTYCTILRSTHTPPLPPPLSRPSATTPSCPIHSSFPRPEKKPSGPPSLLALLPPSPPP